MPRSGVGWKTEQRRLAPYLSKPAFAEIERRSAALNKPKVTIAREILERELLSQAKSPAA